MTQAEAAALEWSDIDYINNVIHVSRTTTKDEKGAVIVGEEPKSVAGKRDIPMNDSIKKVLKEQKNTMHLLHGGIK